VRVKGRQNADGSVEGVHKHKTAKKV
jgi:hypothetical protein